MKLQHLNEVEWRPIEGWPKYEVSNTGEVRNAETEDEVAQWEHTGRGTTYLRVTLRDKGKRWNARVHRLVAGAFLKQRPGETEVDHIDDNGFNNHVDNLEWVTPTENIRRREVSRVTEARYAHDPVIDKIHQFMREVQHPGSREFTREYFEERPLQELIDLLKDHFGKPPLVNDDWIYWIVDGFRVYLAHGDGDGVWVAVERNE